MRLFVSVDVWQKAILTALAIAPLAACGGSTNIGTGGGGSGGAGGTGGTASSRPCQDPTTEQVLGKETGFVSCTGGWQHRPKVATCGSELPRATQCSTGAGGGTAGGCSEDTDCTEKPHGHCESGFDAPECYCAYGCVTDADCGDGQVCLCGAPVGRCVNADCQSDLDCGDGLCATYTSNPGCGGTQFACQSPLDQCTGDGDCPPGEMCTLAGDHRVCEPPGCAIGRPFLVGGEERLAALSARGDWSAKGLSPSLDGLSDEAREALSLRWSKVGLMEHASVAAFARFVLQLLSLGAPPDLVRDAQAAMADETRHAEVCFALAGAYAGVPIGPGPLSIDRAMEASDARSVLVTAIHEGCVGETVAAIEAAETAARAEDPAVREVLTGIAADESRHAELAWRYVRWALGAHPDLIGVARRAFADALRDAPAAGGDDRGALIAHGLPGDGLRREIRRSALAGVVGPCAEALLASFSDRATPAQPAVGEA